MKKRELQASRNKTLPELEKEIRELRARILNLQFDLAAGKIKNAREVRNAKKSLAQLMTLRATRRTAESS